MNTNAAFIAINYINCEPDYKDRFEELFATRAHAIDTMEGFQGMQVLKPKAADSAYLIVSYWKDEKDFQQWTKSPAFMEGHKRGFEDIAIAKKEGKKPPMTSDFKLYSVLTR